MTAMPMQRDLTNDLVRVVAEIELHEDVAVLDPVRAPELTAVEIDEMPRAHLGTHIDLPRDVVKLLGVVEPVDEEASDPDQHQ